MQKEFRMNKDREKAILEILLKNKQVNVKDLAAQLFASEPSIRRDLSSLQKQNLIRRVHGGAILEENTASSTKIPYLLRDMEHSSEKNIIAKYAIDLVKDGDTIFLDASSTACRLIPYLTERKHITVITSGIQALNMLSEYGINAICTGGNSLNSCRSLVGDDALRTINTYRADLCFISCRGISEDGELSDISIEENLIRRCMIKRSKKSYLLCVKDKFNTSYFHKLCDASELDGIITSEKLPSSLQKYKFKESRD